MAILAFASCGKDEPVKPVERKSARLEVSPADTSVMEGESFKLRVAYDSPKGEKPQFEVSDKSVLLVDASGEVIAKTLGEAVITVKLEDLTKTCRVKVTPFDVAIGLSPTDTTIVVGESFRLKTSYYATRGEHPRYGSNNEQVASVDAEGLVTGLKAGEAEIIVYSRMMVERCMVRVVEPKPAAPFVIDIVETTASDIKAKITPSDPSLRYIVSAHYKEGYDKTIATWGDIPSGKRAWWSNKTGERLGGAKYRAEVEKASFKGEQTLNLIDCSGEEYLFPSDHDVVLTVYAIDVDGMEASEIMTQTLHTKRAEVDPTIKFDVKIKQAYPKYVEAVITPSRADVQYFFTIQPKSYVDFYRKPDKDNEIVDNMPSEDYMVYDLLKDDLTNLLKKGTYELNAKNHRLDPYTDYYFVIFAWDRARGRYSAVHYTPFETPDVE